MALGVLIETGRSCKPSIHAYPAFIRAIAFQRNDAAYRYLLEKSRLPRASATRHATEALSMYNYN